jgi:CubicO group peptidase (beta-lactamase class C family)
MMFPTAAWVEAIPESVGVDATRLREAVAFLEASAGKDSACELVIVRRGRLIWKGDNVDHVHGIWSCTKSFTSTVLGLLIADGKCSLDTRAAAFVPELGPTYGGVTLRHFATMTSGYRAVGDETTGSYTHGPSTTPFLPYPTPLFAPGSAYAYWDSAMNELGLVLTRIAGEPLDTVFKRRIADPIGMDPAAWKWGDLGEVAGLRVSCGSGNSGKHVQVSARELARFGHLFLNEGRWNGRQLVPAEWVRAATSVQVPASTKNAWARSGIEGPGLYGFNWWRNAPGPDGKLLWPEAPRATFAALGHNNNKLIVVPDWQMVIVRLGLDQAEKKITDKTVSRFLGEVGGALAAAPSATENVRR